LTGFSGQKLIHLENGTSKTGQVTMTTTLFHVKPLMQENEGNSFLGQDSIYNPERHHSTLQTLQKGTTAGTLQR
jgi:hypothetical protein